ncbi:uncharacterized protein LOC133806190 [Humulus lupulus]|uniref:uncharacterized protein LOC133806190 n=1 Tax=Humulus lupulus TaxID=3486 RepID=UPI002B40BBC3|nr:uncharacterized protein LOC133806190 [Humulus lupulus]
MDLVKICKKQLEMMRDKGWDSLVEEVDLQLQELNSHFNEANTKLLLWMFDLSMKVVETRKDEVYLVYLLIKFPLMLPVATTLVERAFSAMNVVKNQMRNKMGDQWLNDIPTVYLEKDVFNAIDNEPIIHYFQTHEILSTTTLNV